MSKQTFDASAPGATVGFGNKSFELADADTSTGAANTGFHDEIHQIRLGQFKPAASTDNDLLALNTGAPSGVFVPAAAAEAMMATGGGGTSSSGSSGLGTAMGYFGDITYITLAAGAFGHDDPLHLQDHAMRWFEENLRHKHARDNPQAWVSMADALMTQQHLAAQGAKLKPLKLGPLNGEVKAEQKLAQQHKDGSHQAESAKKAMESGLKTQDDYVLAATFLNLEGIEKADQRAQKEAKDHKVEQRALGRMKWNAGETDLTDAVQTDHNTIDPILLELGAPVSYRLEAARFLERYGKTSSRIDYSGLVKKLRADAQTIFDLHDDQTFAYTDQSGTVQLAAMSDPVHRELLNKYGNELKDNAGK